MKVGDIKDTSAQMIQQYQKNENSKQTVDKQLSGAVAAEEKVDLSARAKDMQQIKNAVAKLPDIREEKVKELSDKIDKGAYSINAARLSEKMVGESLIDIFA
jgi:negative regulator of flagellin synthesis FlgM